MDFMQQLAIDRPISNDSASVSKSAVEVALNEIDVIVTDSVTQAEEGGKGAKTRSWVQRGRDAVVVACCCLCRRRADRVETVSTLGNQFRDVSH